MTADITMNKLHQHYERLAEELLDEVPEFQHISLHLDASFGHSDWCQGVLDLDLYMYTDLEWMKLRLGGVKLVDKASLLSHWEATKENRYGDRRRAKPRLNLDELLSDKPKLTLDLDDLGL